MGEEQLPVENTVSKEQVIELIKSIYDPELFIDIFIQLTGWVV